MTIDQLITLAIILLAAYALYIHANVSRLALRNARVATERQGVTLLDESVLLKKIRIRRSSSSVFAIERSYGFEFSTVGDRRYRGELVFLGQRLRHSEMAPFKPSAGSDLI